MLILFISILSSGYWLFDWKFCILHHFLFGAIIHTIPILNLDSSIKTIRPSHNLIFNLIDWCHYKKNGIYQEKCCKTICLVLLFIYFCKTFMQHRRWCSKYGTFFKALSSILLVCNTKLQNSTKTFLFSWPKIFLFLLPSKIPSLHFLFSYF